MSGFNAGEFVEALDWSWRPYVDASGTTPEPSERAIIRYGAAYYAAMGLKMGASEDEIKARSKELEGAGEDAQVEFMGQVRAAVIELSAGSPSAEQVTDAPFRIVRAHARWLFEQMTNPQKPTGPAS